MQSEVEPNCRRDGVPGEAWPAIRVPAPKEQERR
jgi:hypothetical protein